MQLTFDPMNQKEVVHVLAMLNGTAVGVDGTAAAAAVAESPAPKRRRTRKKAAVDPAQSDIEDAAQAAGTVSDPTPEVEQGVAEPAPEPAPAVGEVTVEQVRTAFTAFVQRTNTGEALKLLKKFGVKRVSGLAKEQYADFIKAMNE